MDVVDAVERCGRTRQGLAPLWALKRAKVDHRDLATTAGVHRVARAVYATTPLPPWPRYALTQAGLSREHLVRVRAALLSLGVRATACGRTAALLRGWGLLVEPSRRVEVVLPNGRRPSADGALDCRQARHVERELLCVAPDEDWLWVTTAQQTALDCLLRLPLLEAVVAVDSALRAGAVTLENLRDAVARLPGRREAARGRRALALCDATSGSVLESVLRVRMVQAGITGFAPQRTMVSADGDYLLRVDFCFEEAGLVVEADGAKWHPDPALDRTKDNSLAAAGWRVLRFTWAEIVHDAQGVIALITAALATRPQDCVHLNAA